VTREFSPKPWRGHVPRDRGSIWYIAPIVTAAMLIGVVALFVSAVVFS